MGDVEILINEGGTLNAVQHHSLRSLLRRLKGLERHRVLGWLNCSILPSDFKVPNTTKRPRSPDDSFNRLLRAFFSVVLSLGVIKILCEQSVICSQLSTYNSSPIFAVAIVAAAIIVAAAAIVKKKMNTDFTTLRKEEVKTISGLIQQV